MGDKKGTTCGTYGEKRNTYRILVGKPKGTCRIINKN